MLTKAEIKLITSLAYKKYRDEERLFVVEGEKMTEELLNSGFPVHKLYSTRPVQPVFQFPAEQISLSEMKKITGLKTPSPVLAVVYQPAFPKIEDISLDDLVIAVDELQDPGNLGTIIRLADWFGIRHVVCSQHTVDCFNPKVVQATMGAIFRIKMSYVDLSSFLAQAVKKVPVYGTFLDGSNIYGITLENKAVLVMGNEGNGISETISPYITSRLLIPPFPACRKGCDSLNVAVSTAIACAEFRSRTIQS